MARPRRLGPRKRVRPLLTLADGLYVPGSEEAYRRGCTCPIGANNCGVRSPWPNEQGEDGWWIAEDCDYHHHRKVAKKAPQWRKYHCNILAAVRRPYVDSSGWDVTSVVRRDGICVDPVRSSEEGR